MDHPEKMTIVRERRPIGRTLFWFLGGAAVGAVAALLAAPASGEETRGKLRGIARDQKEKLGKIPVAMKAARAAAEAAFHDALEASAPPSQH